MLTSHKPIKNMSGLKNILINAYSASSYFYPKYLALSFKKIFTLMQGFMCMQGGICMSSMGRPVSYERAVAWKVLNEDETAHCICFMFVNWSFV